MWKVEARAHVSLSPNVVIYYTTNPLAFLHYYNIILSISGYVIYYRTLKRVAAYYVLVFLIFR